MKKGIYFIQATYRISILILAFLNLNLNFNASAQEAQNRLITGVVTDQATGNPLPGVNVSLKGSQTGTITNVQGAYSISVPNGSILVFSYIGYIEQEIETEGKNMI